MSKALCISAAISLALSGAAFAKGTSHSKSAQSAESAASMQITAADCQALTVESARAACLRAAQGQAGAGVGATSDTATGMGHGATTGAPAHTPSKPPKGGSMGGEAAR